MHPTSSQQRQATENRATPPLEQIRPDTWALPLPIVGTSMPYVISYLLLDAHGSVHVVDPGWHGEDNWERFVQGLAQIDLNPSDVKTIVATHMHRDHIGLAERMRCETGAPLAISAAEQDGIRKIAALSPEHAVHEVAGWGAPSDRRDEIEATASTRFVSEAISADRTLHSGDVLAIPGRNVRVIQTPGHTGGHICLVEPSQEILFTGDHILPDVYPGVGLGAATRENPIAQYLESVAALSFADSYEVCPAHGYRFRGLRQRRQQLTQHVLQRAHRTRTLMRESPEATVWQIGEQIEWSGGWANLRGTRLRSALAQTAMYMNFVRTEWPAE